MTTYQEQVINGILCGSTDGNWQPVSSKELTRRLLEAQHSIVGLSQRVLELEASFHRPRKRPKMTTIFPKIKSETPTEIYLEDGDEPLIIPTIEVVPGESWIKHVHLDGARFHVLSWSGDFQGHAHRHCSEPNCIINKTEDEK